MIVPAMQPTGNDAAIDRNRLDNDDSVEAPALHAEVLKTMQLQLAQIAAALGLSEEGAVDLGWGSGSAMEAPRGTD